MLQFEVEKVGGVIFVQTTQRESLRYISTHMHTTTHVHTYTLAHTHTKEGREREKIKGVFISGGG